jgi:hypothetical protein
MAVVLIIGPIFEADLLAESGAKQPVIPIHSNH